MWLPKLGCTFCSVWESACQLEWVHFQLTVSFAGEWGLSSGKVTIIEMSFKRA